jgi:hypothetical protein
MRWVMGVEQGVDRQFAVGGLNVVDHLTGRRLRISDELFGVLLEVRLKPLWGGGSGASCVVDAFVWSVPDCSSLSSPQATSTTPASPIASEANSAPAPVFHFLMRVLPLRNCTRSRAKASVRHPRRSLPKPPHDSRERPPPSATTGPVRQTPRSCLEPEAAAPSSLAVLLRWTSASVGAGDPLAIASASEGERSIAVPT